MSKHNKKGHKMSVHKHGSRDTNAVKHSSTCNCSDCCAERRKKYGLDNTQDGWQRWLRDCYPQTTSYAKSCNHFRQEVKFGKGDKYSLYCSAYRDIPKKDEDIAKAIVPDIGIYLDSLWNDVVDPIKTSPKVTDYPQCAEYYGSILVKWPDRGIPSSKSMVVELVDYLVEKVKSGKKIDIGCHGGHGRTGTLAGCIIAKLCPSMHPLDVIKFVREKYCKEAIESKTQEDFIYEIMGKEPPKPPPTPQSLPAIYHTYPARTEKKYDGWATQALLTLVDKEKLDILECGKAHINYTCDECNNLVKEGMLVWHNTPFNYRVCDFCYRLMKERVKPGSYWSDDDKEKDDKWEVSFRADYKNSTMSCDDCKALFKPGEKMWHHGDNWTPLLCDTCYDKFLNKANAEKNIKELEKDVLGAPDVPVKGPDGVSHCVPPDESVIKITVDPDDEERDQFAYLLGFTSAKELAKEIQKVLAKS